MFDFFDDFIPDWDDIALAAAMGEEMADRECDSEMRFNDETDEQEK